jgi:hypothetical protein
MTIVLMGLAERHDVRGRFLFVMLSMIVFIVGMIVMRLRVTPISRSIGGRSNKSMVIGLRRRLFVYRMRVFMLLVSVFSMMIVMGVLIVMMAFVAMALRAMTMLAMTMLVMVVVVMIVPMIIMMIWICIMKVLRRVIADLSYICRLLPVDEGGGVLDDVTLHPLAMAAPPGIAVTRAAPI